MFLDIPGSERWQWVAPVDKGWSSDRKFRVETGTGERLLLRLSDAAQREAKRKEFEIISKYATLGFDMSMPVDFGTCTAGVYMLLTWVEGRDLEDVLPGLSEAEQYRLGRAAGEILRRLHALPVEAVDMPTETKRRRKLKQLARYAASGVRTEDDGPVIDFVRDHIDRIWQRPPVYQHGDFHPGNLIHRPDGAIGVIDFNRWEVGDPYEEFYKLQSFGREISVPYCVGQIDAYFGDAVPTDFWETLAVYVAHASLYSIVWAEPFGAADVAGMTRRCRLAMEDYEGFERSMPKWYEAWKNA